MINDLHQTDSGIIIEEKFPIGELQNERERELSDLERLNRAAGEFGITTEDLIKFFPLLRKDVTSLQELIDSIIIAQCKDNPRELEKHAESRAGVELEIFLENDVVESKDDSGNSVFTSRYKISEVPIYSESAIKNLLNQKIALYRNSFAQFADAPNYLKAIDQYIDRLISSDEFKDIIYSDSELEKREPLMEIKNHAFMNDKANKGLMTNMQLQENGTYKANINMSNSTPYTVGIALTYKGKEISFSKPYNYHKEAILNAICSQANAQKLKNLKTPLNTYPFYITVDEIWRTMVGTNDKRKHPSPEEQTAIINDLNEMRFTETYIDISKETNLNYSFDEEHVTKGFIQDNMLHAKWAKLETDFGNTYSALAILTEPILQYYNLAKNHVLFIDNKLLDVSNKTRMGGYTIPFRDYLLLEIQQMKTGYRSSNRILFNSIYESKGLTKPEDRGKGVKDQRRSDREKICAILDSFIEKKFITGYKTAKKGRSIVGVDIFSKDIDAKKKAVKKSRLNKK